MNWWLWATMGLVLAGIELFTPGGFFVIFFGVGALVTALAVALIDLADVWQWLLFTAVSVASLILFRKPLLAYMKPKNLASAQVDSLTNEIAAAGEYISPGEIGQVELRGSGWKAKNITDKPILKGQRCCVDRVDGLVLWIRPEGGHR